MPGMDRVQPPTRPAWSSRRTARRTSPGPIAGEN